MNASTEMSPGAASFDVGSGDAWIIAIHGFGGTPYDFRDWAERMAERGFHVFAPLLPGHGHGEVALAASHVADWRDAVVREIQRIEAQHPRQIILLGTSFGGALALDIAGHSASVSAVILVNPAFRYRKLTPLARGYLQVRSMWSPILPKLGLHEDDHARARVSGSTLGWPIKTLLETHRYLRDIPSFLRRLKRPMLILESVGDSYVDSGFTKKLIAGLRLQGIEYDQLDHHGHRPFRSEDATKKMVELIAGFIQRVCR